jgi:hypothetical protein
VRPALVNRIVYTLYALCALSVVLDLFVHRHEKFAFAGSFGFYAGYGFVACVALVLAAKGLRRLLMRDENYYGEADD